MNRLLIVLFLFISAIASGQGEKADSRLNWFNDAKLGIFIHWGIYSVNGISESWSFHNRRISHPEYMQQLNGFTATAYNPGQWVSLIQGSGARYAVITSKHHDGVALWNTKMNDLAISLKSPVKRDVLTPFINELRKAGLKAGLYFSLIDWTHPDYPGFLRDSAKYMLAEHPERWERFLEFMNGQLDELITGFNPDLWWFDGDWEHNADEWKAAAIRQKLLSHNPEAIINGRLAGSGDYDTPEQNFPVTRPDLPAWELCMTMNDSWGYQTKDTNYKTPYEIISIFADVIGFGGNLLLDIGPKADGTIPEEQINILKELGKWTGKHSEAIFGTRAGLPQGHFYGPSTLSSDSLNLYLFVAGGSCRQISVKGLNNAVRNAVVVGTGLTLQPKVVGKISWSPVPGLVFLDIPDGAGDEYMTVVKLTFDKPVSLYRGKGGLQ
ncbi:MAG: alpha-L-fucosidase [Bacteroidota bacterium]